MIWALTRSSFFSSTATKRFPSVNCEHCDQVTSASFGDPFVRVADFEDVLCADDWDTPYISFAEFEKIRARGKRLYGEDVTLMPGAQVGEFDFYAQGKAPSNLYEVEEAQPGGLLFSKRLLAALSASDIFLQTVDHQLRQLNGTVRFYGHTQTPVYDILNPQCLSGTGNERCDHCGQVFTNDPKCKVVDKLLLNRGTTAEETPIFRVMGYDGLLFLRDDVAAVFQAIDNLGAELKPWGEWV